MLCALSHFLDRGNHNNNNNNNTASSSADGEEDTTDGSASPGSEKKSAIGDGSCSDGSSDNISYASLNNNNNNNNNNVTSKSKETSFNTFKSCIFQDGSGSGSNGYNFFSSGKDKDKDKDSSATAPNYFRHNRRHLPVPHGPYTVGSVDLMCDLSDHGAFFRMYYPTSHTDNIHAHYKQWPLWLPRKQYAWGFVLFLKRNKKIFGRLANWLGGDVYVPSLWQAPLLREDKRYPVIIVSHGIGGNRTYLSSYCCELASHGFVVAALEHRDGSASMTLCLEEQLKSSIRDSNDHYGSDYNLHDTKCKDILNNSFNGGSSSSSSSSSSTGNNNGGTSSTDGVCSDNCAGGGSTCDSKSSNSSISQNDYKVEGDGDHVDNGDDDDDHDHDAVDSSRIAEAEKVHVEKDKNNKNNTLSHKTCDNNDSCSSNHSNNSHNSNSATTDANCNKYNNNEGDRLLSNKDTVKCTNENDNTNNTTTTTTTSTTNNNGTNKHTSKINSNTNHTHNDNTRSPPAMHQSSKKPRLRKCRSAAAALREYFSDDGDHANSSPDSNSRRKSTTTSPNTSSNATTASSSSSSSSTSSLKSPSSTSSPSAQPKDIEEAQQDIQFRSWDRRRHKRQRSLRQQESCSEEWRPFQHISVWDDFDYRNNQMYYRAHEISEVLDELVAINGGRHINNALGLAFKTAQFKNRLDMSRVAVIGHSFGAASALAALNTDKRFATGISLDGWMHPVDKSVYENTQQPTLFLNMEQFQWERNVNQILKFISCKPEADRPLLTLLGGCHQSCTDFQFLVPHMVGRFLDVCWTLQPELCMATCVTTSLAFLYKQFGLPMEQKHVDALNGKSPHLLSGTNVDLTIPDDGPTPP